MILLLILSQIVRCPTIVKLTVILTGTQITNCHQKSQNFRQVHYYMLCFFLQLIFVLYLTNIGIVVGSPSYRKKLAAWAVKNQCLHSHLNELLRISRELDPTLPLDARTLLSAPRNIALTVMSPGLYFHFGLLISRERKVMLNKTAKYSKTTGEKCI